MKRSQIVGQLEILVNDLQMTLKTIKEKEDDVDELSILGASGKFLKGIGEELSLPRNCKDSS